MDDLIRRTLLLDFYGELLTPKQREFMTLYYFEDLSLSEVAEIRGITPQGVRDLLRRTEKLLERYEARLGLLEKHTRRRDGATGVLRYIRESGGIAEADKQKLTGMVEELTRD